MTTQPHTHHDHARQHDHDGPHDGRNHSHHDHGHHGGLHAYEHAHESPAVMLVPLGVLAIGVVLMMWTRLRHPAYFRGETLPQTDSTRPIPIIRPDDDGTAVVRDPNERTHS